MRKKNTKIHIKKLRKIHPGLGSTQNAVNRTGKTDLH